MYILFYTRVCFELLQSVYKMLTVYSRANCWTSQPMCCLLSLTLKHLFHLAL